MGYPSATTSETLSSDKHVPVTVRPRRGDWPMRNLGQMFAASAATLKADLARLRAGQSHAASKGSSAEEALRKLLRQHLPASIGITSGQIADSSGAMSKQFDAILYDAAHTPMIFQSFDGGVGTVPAEGVLACRIKTQLRSDMLSGILGNCHSVKSLDRSAFVPQHITPRYWAYDRSWTDLPIHYSVFAFGSRWDLLREAERTPARAGAPRTRRPRRLPRSRRQPQRLPGERTETQHPSTGRPPRLPSGD